MGTHVEGNEVDFGMTVLSCLGGRHINDLAGTAYGEVVRNDSDPLN